MPSYVVVRNSMNPPYTFSKFHDDKIKAINEAQRLNKKHKIPFVVMKVVGVAKDEEYIYKGE